MQIQLSRNSHYYINGYCRMCGEPFIPDSVIAIAYSQAGAELGLLCDQCLQAGRGALSARMQRHAADLRGRAEALERLLAEDITFPKRADWQMLEEEHTANDADYLSGLWYESLNQMVAV